MASNGETIFSYLTLFDGFVVEGNKLLMSAGVKLADVMIAASADVPVTFDVISLNRLSVFTVVVACFIVFSFAAKSIAVILTMLLFGGTVVGAGFGFFGAVVVGCLVVGFDVLSVGFLFSFRL